MIPGWLAVFAFLAYVAALLPLARHGDESRSLAVDPCSRAAIYALGACVYCNSVSFFGSTGLASRRGLDMLPSYLGPAIAFAVFYPILTRMIRLSKTQSITSISDFVGARYGKQVSVSATITVVALVAYVPFVALQIKAIAQSLAIFIDGRVPRHSEVTGSCRAAALLVAPLLVLMTIVVGGRRVDATAPRRGLMLILAVETMVRLTALAGVGAFVCWGMFSGIGDMTDRIAHDARIASIVDRPHDPSSWFPLLAATLCATFVMPQQFQVSVVENRDEIDIRTAAWVVPLSIALMILFTLILAVGGLMVFPDGAIDRDFTILALPIHAGAPIVTLLALIGGFSAATAIILVTTFALSVMVTNDIVMPIYLRATTRWSTPREQSTAPAILAARTIATAGLIATATSCAIATSGATLSTLGFFSLAVVAQIVPAALIGMVWRRGTARGAIGGTIAGLAVSIYTLGLPSILPPSALTSDGPFALGALRPIALFGTGITPVGNGLVWSLAANLVLYVALSLAHGATANERLQADVFVDLRRAGKPAPFRVGRGSLSIETLLASVSRHVGRERAEHAFAGYHAARGLPFDLQGDADARLVQRAEHLVASTMGTASARMVMSLLIASSDLSRDAARRLVDEVSLEIQNSRDILQHAIDVARDGMAIYDADYRLVAWNRAYREMFGLPTSLMRVGQPLDAMIRSNAARGIYGENADDTTIEDRYEALIHPTDGLRLHVGASNRVLEMRSVRLANGGLYFTYTDATAEALSKEELEAENETLERRVRERTEELEALNLELARAKADADDANISKSRFLAAASHDILQPLSAARLYATSLSERLRAKPTGEDAQTLAENVDAALEAVEDILGALLEISQLDAGATKIELTCFDIQSILGQLKMEFEPVALKRGLRLTMVPSSLIVRSDRRLLRRLLQNLISNALKYTVDGRVVVGARRGCRTVTINVVDSGIGIPASKQGVIFREFERLPAGAQVAQGAGLGLSIVQRLGLMLRHDVRLCSEVGKGSAFAVDIPRATSSVVEATVSVLPGASQRQGLLDGLVVAVIDNERPILAALESLLQGWNCAVVGGTTLEEIEAALDARGLDPDVIVADYHVGDLDGLSIVAAMRRRYGACPAVLVTADRGSHVRELAQAADVRVLNKPLKPATLRALLAQWSLTKAAP